MAITTITTTTINTLPIPCTTSALVGYSKSSVRRQPFPSCKPFGYAFAGWGTALYLWSGLLYLVQFALALRSAAQRQATPPPSTQDSPPGGVGSAGRR